MTQAVWRSPILPREREKGLVNVEHDAQFGSGLRFKTDLLNYLRAYGSGKTGRLVEKLSAFDFSAIRAALVGSVPSKQLSSANRMPYETLWGWLGLKNVLEDMPCSGNATDPPAVIAIQVSSIASLGSTDAWMKNLEKTLASSQVRSSKQPRFRIIFPSADEIRRSIGGYSSGGSIHTPNSTRAAQQKQLHYLKSKMCYWAGDGAQSTSDTERREAGRRRAAPHIKTYIRFRGDDMQHMDWAMITSANLSKQAWGELPNQNGEVKISSFELGVIFWPELFASAEEGRAEAGVVMVPTFGSDIPSLRGTDTAQGETLVGFRMPYDLPLVPYHASETPWCNKISHGELDWKGDKWTA